MKLLCLVNTVILPVAKGNDSRRRSRAALSSLTASRDREDHALTTHGERVVAGLCAPSADLP
jgi:hypothetical protein